MKTRFNPVQSQVILVDHGDKWAPVTLLRAMKHRDAGRRDLMRASALRWRKLRNWQLGLSLEGGAI